MENHNPHHVVMVTERLTHVRHLGQFSHSRSSIHGSCQTYWAADRKGGFGTRTGHLCGTSHGHSQEPESSPGTPQGTAGQSPPETPPCRPPAVSPPGSNTHTCLRPRTLAASGGEKGNALCFKDVFVSVGGETPKFEESMAKTFLLGL